MRVRIGPNELELVTGDITEMDVEAIVNPANSNAELDTREAQDAARILGLRLHILHAKNESEIDTAFVTLAQQGAGALVVSADVPFISRRDQFVALAARHGVPAIYAYREFADAGGLVSYGSTLNELAERAAELVAKILRGAKPNELPLQQATRVYLTINLKSARELGYHIPQSLLQRADFVVDAD